MNKQLRKIVVNGVNYLWYIPGNAIDKKEVHITILKADSKNGQKVKLDPYNWYLEIRPKIIKEAILFAKSKGWNPNEACKDMIIGFKEEKFTLIEIGHKFIY